MKMNRRGIIAGGLASTCVSFLSDSSAANTTMNSNADRKIHGFSKHFQDLSLTELIKFAHQVGWDGVDLTVRKGGHISPEDVGAKLKEWVRALNSEGLSTEVMTTDLKECKSPTSNRLLQTAAESGVKQFRLGYWMYDLLRPVTEQLDSIRVELDSIAKVCRSLEITAGYQNHSGERYVGASLWDIWYLVKDISPRDVSAIFDVGHAVAEGALSWPNDWRLLAPHVSCIYVKDFQWVTENGEIKIQWRPFGKGVVPSRFFELVREFGFNGPISLHHEYAIPLADEERIRVIRADTDALVSALKR